MATDSSAAGFLVPVAEPLADDALTDALQPTLVGLTGLPGVMVRPRWQPRPPNQPQAGQNWLAFGINNTESDTYADHVHAPEGGEGWTGSMSIERDETLFVLLSFYGPSAKRNAERVRAGIVLDQNRASLAQYNLFVVECQAAVPVPALVHDLWTARVDTTLVLRRRLVHEYAVLTALPPADSFLDNDLYRTPLNVPTQGE